MTTPLMVQLMIYTIILWIFYHIITNRKFYESALRLPSLHPLIPSFLVGLTIVPLKKFNIYRFYKSYQDRQEDFGSWWFIKLYVVIRRPEFLHKYFFDPQLLNKSVNYDTISKAIGETGLLSAGGETFKTAKQVFLKSFITNHQDKLNIENFYRGTKELISILENQEKLTPIIKEITAKNICRAALDIELTKESELWKVINDLEDLFKAALINEMFKLNLLPYQLSPFTKKVTEAKNRGDAFASEVRSQKRTELKRMLNNNEEPPNQFIYNLLRERADAPDYVIDTDIMSLILAALDTTAITISLTLTMLGMNPEIQENVYKEDQRIQEELDGRIMSENDFKKYEYLNRVIKETLRLYPPVPNIERNAGNDIEIGKRTIPKDSTVVLFMPYIQRDPKNFANPLKFDPDRFLPENLSKIHKFAYIPFSMGPRQCPGMRYGMQSALFIVSSVIRKFKVVSKYNSIEELDRNMSGFITVSDKGEFPVRLELRSHSIASIHSA